MEKRDDICTTKIVEDVFYGDAASTSMQNRSTRITGNVRIKRKNASTPTVEWVKKKKSNRNNFFKYAKVGDIFINQGDSVTLANDNGEGHDQIAYVAYMFQDPQGKEKMCHAHFYFRGSDTILGDKANSSELFFTKHCENVELSSIIGKVKVSQKVYDSTWQLEGGSKGEIEKKQDETVFYFSKIFEKQTGRFIDYVKVPEAQCMSCFWKQKDEDHDKVMVQKNRAKGDFFVEDRGEKYYVGTAVFIDYERKPVPKVRKRKEKCDEEDDGLTLAIVNGSERYLTKFEMKLIFPEKYRSPGDHEHFEKPCEPYLVGVIERIKENGRIAFREFWRVEDTQSKKYGDPNLIYWTKHLYHLASLKKWKSVVKGKCFVSHTKHIPDKYQWVQEGPNRFYFNQQYNPDTDLYEVLPEVAENIGLTGTNYNPESAPIWLKTDTKLKCMDIYAGCGGLSNGLEKSGFFETKWAIEYDPAAAKAFQLNHPEAKVLARDCNDVLRMLLKGKFSSKVKNLPKKGKVDIIVGGPPCQGFSLINRFQTGEKSKKNNCQINTYLGFIDYYRPKYFIFENVQNFARKDKGDYFKLFLKCLLEIGYQATFGVLQAGNFGIPQSRHRLFIIGAAPGLKLPTMPRKTHCFGRFERKDDSIRVDNVLYNNGGEIGVWGSLPLRRVTVRDAIDDLPHVSFDDMAEETLYEEKLNTALYARLLRQNCHPRNVVTEHLCKQFSHIYQRRMGLIPAGGDWTDLPNTNLTYIPGNYNTLTEKLKYYYRNDAKTGEYVRAVKQISDEPTIIPIELASTPFKGNNWHGVYGRVKWDGHFETVLTKPNPAGFQGRVIHPEQNRVLTVREYARAQGFSDDFRFDGTINKKYQQIGNAVPPILATALGREVGKAALDSSN